MYRREATRGNGGYNPSRRSPAVFMQSSAIFIIFNTVLRMHTRILIQLPVQYAVHYTVVAISSNTSLSFHGSL